MNLSEPQKKHLRGIGHGLHPLIMVGDAGVSDGVMNEFNNTIDHHELIKVKIRSGDREQRDAMIEDLCKRGQAELVTRIGNVALMFRRNAEKPKIKLPRA